VAVIGASFSGEVLVPIISKPELLAAIGASASSSLGLRLLLFAAWLNLGFRIAGCPAFFFAQAEHLPPSQIGSWQGTTLAEVPGLQAAQPRHRHFALSVDDDDDDRADNRSLVELRAARED